MSLIPPEQERTKRGFLPETSQHSPEGFHRLKFFLSCPSSCWLQEAEIR